MFALIHSFIKLYYYASLSTLYFGQLPDPIQTAWRATCACMYLLLVCKSIFVSEVHIVLHEGACRLHAEKCIYSMPQKSHRTVGPSNLIFFKYIILICIILCIPKKASSNLQVTLLKIASIVITCKH